MRINHNLMAINTHRQLGVSQVDGAKSTEKLSSGLRINRAGDDAAGLAISEKMRGQIRGLNQASRNSSDTISLIQTAEGALNETHSIIQRMRELAVQAANDTNTDADRKEIQSEIDQLIKEVDRIGNTTEFNTKKLLDGSARGVSDAVTATAGLNPNSSVKVNLDVQNAFQAKISDDTNFFMNGAHMLVRKSNSETTTGVMNIESDFEFVGPDGTAYSFLKGTADGNPLATANWLQPNSILTSEQKVSEFGSKDDILKEVATRVNNAVTAAVSAFNGGVLGSGTTPGSTNSAEFQAVAVAAADEAIDKLIEEFGGVKTEVGKALADLKSGVNSDNKTAFEALIDTTANVGDPALSTTPLAYGNLTEGTNKITTAVVNEANSLRTNVTLGAGSDIKDGTKLAAGTILSKGSEFTVGTGTSITIEVDKANVKIELGSDGVIKVNGTSLADDASMVLKDGTVLKSTTGGKIEIAQGFVKLAAETTVDATGDGVNSVKQNSVIAAGSLIEADSVFGAGSVIGDKANKELVRGSVDFDANAKSITFGGGVDHKLEANFAEMSVGLSNTFVFKAFQAGSNDLDNSVMGQVGANSGQILFLSMNDMRAAALGIDKIDVTSRYAATAAVEMVNNALEKVSHQRSTLGAIQNRLEHTIKNLDTAAENLQASEARVRDVDMAKEIMENTRLNILQQASQAMLAQANQAPQSVLQLLR